MVCDEHKVFPVSLSVLGGSINIPRFILHYATSLAVPDFNTQSLHLKS